MLLTVLEKAHESEVLRPTTKASFRPEQADAVAFQLRSCEVVGLRSGGISLRCIAQPHRFNP
jgi:hypothetical protein